MTTTPANVIETTTYGTRVEVATLHRPACIGRIVSHTVVNGTVDIAWRAAGERGRVCRWVGTFNVETGESDDTGWGVIGMM